jgi:hypothetical protein
MGQRQPGQRVVDARGVADGVTFGGDAGDDTFFSGDGADVFYGSANGLKGDTLVESGKAADYSFRGDGTSWYVTNKAGVSDVVYDVEWFKFDDKIIDTSKLDRTIWWDHSSGTMNGGVGNDHITASNGSFTMIGNGGHLRLLRLRQRHLHRRHRRGRVRLSHRCRPRDGDRFPGRD